MLEQSSSMLLYPLLPTHFGTFRVEGRADPEVHAFCSKIASKANPLWVCAT